MPKKIYARIFSFKPIAFQTKIGAQKNKKAGYKISEIEGFSPGRKRGIHPNIKIKDKKTIIKKQINNFKKLLFKKFISFNKKRPSKVSLLGFLSPFLGRPGSAPSKVDHFKIDKVHPQVPLRMPCYDFTLVARETLKSDNRPLQVSLTPLM